MTTLILLALVLLLVHIFTPALLAFPSIGLTAYMGPRDAPPPDGVVLGRARRAQRNFAETLPIFLTLAVLALVLPEAAVGSAVTGAWIWLICRAAYLVLYLAGVPWLRSMVWSGALVGLAIMAVAVF